MLDLKVQSVLQLQRQKEFTTFDQSIKRRLLLEGFEARFSY